MPDGLQIRRRRALDLRFLHLVLAEMDLTFRNSRAHGVGAEGFRNRDERDVGGVASGPGGGARDAIADVRQPGTEQSGVRHDVAGLRGPPYFGSWATRALAVAAFVPSGDIFR